MHPNATETHVFHEPGVGLNDAAALRREIRSLRDRLSKLSEASLRVTEDLDLDTALQEVVDSARALTGARYGVVRTFDDSGEAQDFATSGLTQEEHQRVAYLPEGREVVDYLNSFQVPLRLRDLGSHIGSLGFSSDLTQFKDFLGTRMHYRGVYVGNFYLANKEGSQEFTTEDEEVLVMFASQAATAIANARQYRNEQRARADLDALIDASPIGILIFDAKTGSLMSVNEETKRIVKAVRGQGRSIEQLLDVLTLRRIDGREVSLDESPLARTLITGETVRAEEIVIHSPDGRSVTTLVNAKPIHSEEGEIVSVVVTLQDMTKLEELERLRAEFLGMVSQELRTPLTTIKGSTATVLNSSLPLDSAEMRQFIQIIDEQADHMRSLISELLDVARIEAGTLSVTPEPIDVADVIEQAMSAFLHGEARNRIEVDIAPELHRIQADGQRMLQVLNNLLSNASRHSPESSAIRVIASPDDVFVAISVVYEGRGISAERLPLLFSKFSRTGGWVGESLGLAICKGIVEAHGGRIWAESEGMGLSTRFTFTIPVVDDAAGDWARGHGRLPVDSARTARGQGRILAVDNDPQMLRHVRNTLREAGYTLVATENPDEAERLVKMEKPHLVLLDAALSGAGGFELMRRIVEVGDVPVIFLSGRDGDQIVARAFEMGADDYIVKPFSPTELLARVEAVLRRQAASTRTNTREPYLLGDLTIDYAERRVAVEGHPVQLTATEYQLLFELSTNAGRVLTQDHLLRRVWGPEYLGDSQPLRTFVKKLRRKLGEDASSPIYIFTVPRVGYRMAKSEG